MIRLSSYSTLQNNSASQSRQELFILSTSPGPTGLVCRQNSDAASHWSRTRFVFQTPTANHGIPSAESAVRSFERGLSNRVRKFRVFRFSGRGSSESRNGTTRPTKGAVRRILFCTRCCRVLFPLSLPSLPLRRAASRNDESMRPSSRRL